MFFFSFEVKPRPGSSEAAEFAGGYANCWIDFKSHWGAQKLAELAIADRGWDIERLDREFETGREFYRGDEDDFQYFEEAERDGWSIVLFTYGHDTPHVNTDGKG